MKSVVIMGNKSKDDMERLKKSPDWIRFEMNNSRAIWRIFWHEGKTVTKWGFMSIIRVQRALFPYIFITGGEGELPTSLQP